MTRRIFRSILGVSLAVLAASLVLVTGVLYGYVQDRVGQELAARAAYVARGVEQSGAAYLADLPGDSRITWVAADGTGRRSPAPGLSGGGPGPPHGPGGGPGGGADPEGV